MTEVSPTTAEPVCNLATLASRAAAESLFYFPGLDLTLWQSRPFASASPGLVAAFEPGWSAGTIWIC